MIGKGAAGRKDMFSSVCQDKEAVGTEDRGKRQRRSVLRRGLKTPFQWRDGFGWGLHLTLASDHIFLGTAGMRAGV